MIYNVYIYVIYFIPFPFSFYSKIQKFSKIQKYETLVMGINAKDPFFYSTNTTISNAV